MLYDKLINYSPVLVGAVGVLVTHLAYAPGLVPADALNQLAQAQTGHFNDIYPPLLAWLWSKTNHVIPGPGGLFLLLIALYWLGFYFVIRTALEISLTRGIIAIALPFSPILFNFVGTIWTDILVFGCFLVATGILLTRRPDATAWPRVLSSLIALFLVLVGALARWNSVAAAMPLVLLAIWPHPPLIAPLRRTFYRLILCAPIVLLAWAGAAKLLDVAATHTEKTGFANMLPLWDLVGMSHYLGINLLPGSWSDRQSKDIIGSCYNPVNDNGIGVAGAPCNFIRVEVTNAGYWHAGAMFSLWAGEIWRHPGAYVKTRLSYVRALFWPNNVFMFDADDGANMFNHHAGFLFKSEKQVLRYLRTAPVLHFFFTLGFWALAAAILTVILAIGLARGRAGWYASLLLSLSAGANLWPLVIIGPDSQFRYAYWSIAAIFVALLIASREPRAAGEARAQAAGPGVAAVH